MDKGLQEVVEVIKRIAHRYNEFMDKYEKEHDQRMHLYTSIADRLKIKG